MADDLSDFFDAEPRRMPLGRGGARPGAGRKRRDANGEPSRNANHPDKVKTPPAPKPSDGESAYTRYERARAEKEEQLARQAKVKADLDEGKVVEREAVRTSAARAFQTISQSLDAIGDSLERSLGLAPEVIEAINNHIAEAKGQLMTDLQAMYEDAVE